VLVLGFLTDAPMNIDESMLGKISSEINLLDIVYCSRLEERGGGEDNSRKVIYISSLRILRSD
jgi:hypothetical protein